MNKDDRARAALAGLVGRYGLGEREHEQLRALLEVLARDERAPTAVRSPERAVDVHIADSLVALELEVARSAGTIADLGAGAGFPGLALAAAAPRSEVRLVESQTRKCVYLNRVIAEVGLENAHAVCVRAEEWREGAQGHDVVVARAVAGQPVVLEYAAPLLRLGGTLVDWRGKRVQEEEDAALRAAGELGLRRVEVRRVAPFEGASEHHLHLYLKVRDTPARFPRRAGMASKRPLGFASPRGGRSGRSKVGP
jgi:16S rRNA (guanine527-N7)-methyltransferase